MILNKRTWEKNLTGLKQHSIIQVSATSFLCWLVLIHFFFFHSDNGNSDLAGQRAPRHSYCDCNYHQDIQGRSVDNHTSWGNHVSEAGVTMQEVPIASQRYAHPYTLIRSIGSDEIPTSLFIFYVMTGANFIIMGQVDDQGRGILEPGAFTALYKALHDRLLTNINNQPC